MVLTAADHVLQTIYNDKEEELEAVILDEISGKLATCSGSNIYVYRPYGREEGILKGDTKIGSD